MSTTPVQFYGNNGVQPCMYPEKARSASVQLKASTTYPKGTVLGELVGNNEVQTVTVDATSGTYTLTFNGSTTSAIAFDATAATVQAALLALASISAAGKQTVTISGSPTGGTFKLSYDGQTTSALAYNATATVVQTALRALGTIGGSNVTVSGSAGGPYTVLFAGDLATIRPATLAADSTGLTGGTPSIAVAVVNAGGDPAGVSVTGSAGGPYTVTFQNHLGNTDVGAMTANSGSLSGNTHTASIVTTTAGSAGTPGQFAPYADSASDGSQVAKAVVKYDCKTDASNNVTFGLGGTSPWGETYPTAPVWIEGYFSTLDLVGLDAAAVTDLGKLVQGTLAGGGVLKIE